jgi:hypothetical protein
MLAEFWPTDSLLDSLDFRGLVIVSPLLLRDGVRGTISVRPVVYSALADDRPHESITLIVEDWATQRSIDGNLAKVRSSEAGELSVKVRERA